MVVTVWWHCTWVLAIWLITVAPVALLLWVVFQCMPPYDGTPCTMSGNYNSAYRGATGFLLADSDSPWNSTHKTCIIYGGRVTGSRSSMSCPWTWVITMCPPYGPIVLSLVFPILQGYTQCYLHVWSFHVPIRFCLLVTILPILSCNLVGVKL